MLDDDSVRRLRCPVNLGKLTQADADLIDRVNRLIEGQGLSTRGGQPQSEPVEGGLVTDDRRYLYPIQDGIVCMLVESAIELELVINDAPE
jgi:uncharacterized protein YbaR (Trm112 family)